MRRRLLAAALTAAWLGCADVAIAATHHSRHATDPDQPGVLMTLLAIAFMLGVVGVFFVLPVVLVFKLAHRAGHALRGDRHEDDPHHHHYHDHGHHHHHHH